MNSNLALVKGTSQMTLKLYSVASWFASNSVRIRLVILTLIVMLMVAALFVPGLVSLADSVPSGGGH